MSQVVQLLGAGQCRSSELTGDISARKKDDMSSTRLEKVELTAGQIDNNHVSVRQIRDFFPADSIGSSNRHKGLGKMLRLHVRGFAKPIETDIAGDKGIFRTRCWGQFFRTHDLKPGDCIIIEKLAEYEYKMYPAKSLPLSG